MKKMQTLFILTLLLTAEVSAQKSATIDKSPLLIPASKVIVKKETFGLNTAGIQAFTPRTIVEILPGAGAEDKSKTFKLPNGKTTTVAKHVEEINAFEKRLADLGVKQLAVPKTIVLSKMNNNIGGTIIPDVSGVNLTIASGASVSSRFGKINSQAFNKLKRLPPAAFAALRASEVADLPAIEIDREEGLPEKKFKVAGYGVTVVARQHEKGKIQPFYLTDADRTAAGLTEAAKATSNTMNMGFDATIKVEVPGIGQLDAYKLAGDFTSKSNSQQKHHVKTKITVLGTVLVDDDKDLPGDDVSYNKNRIYNTSKLLGAADFFTYALNALMPVDFYLNATGVGGEFDVDITRTGVSGSVTPLVAQSIYVETSIAETTGPVADMLGNSIDAGVAGELRVIEGGISFNANMGLALNGKQLVLLDDVYQGFDLKLLRGRLYTFTEYPWFKCNNIWSFGDVNCWEMIRQENDIFNSGSAISFKHVMRDEDLSKKLNW